jgi:uncharacterized protein (DUF1501 family)
MVGCSAAIAAMAGASLGRVAFATPGSAAANGNDTLVVLFLRGGWDALSVLPPIDGADRGLYEKARPGLKIPVKGDKAAIGLNGQLGLHPALKPLHELYRGGQMAIVQATGLEHDTRSHFDAMDFMELGTPGIKTTTSGWITRHLASLGGSQSVVIPAIGIGNTPASLLAMDRAVAVGSLEEMSLPGGGDLFDKKNKILRRMYGGERWIDKAGALALSTVDTFLESAPDRKYTPAKGVSYPDNELGRSLKSAAQMLKLDLGVQALSVDFGGWDTHDWQADTSDPMRGQLPEQLSALSGGLAAFYADLAASGHDKRTTIVVMSEFGRRLAQNENSGTDHGHGSAIFALGGNVKGGKVYGSWPGLASEQLFENTDLAITTDYRSVLSEIVTKRLGNPNIDKVFPGFGGYTPLGIVS